MQQLMRNHSQKNNEGIILQLHITSYLSIPLSKILPHLKTIINAKKLLIFGENDSRHFYNFL